MGNYSTTCLGQILQKILGTNDSALSVLKWNWEQLMQNDCSRISPIKYTESTKILMISTKEPLIYMQHFRELVKRRCNQFLGYNAIEIVKLVQDKKPR
jgi:hypothetical protein